MLSPEEILRLQKNRKEWSAIKIESEEFKLLFVPWDIAKRLKVNSYNELTFAYFWVDKDTFTYTVQYQPHNKSTLKAAAPLWDQVIKWFDKLRIFIDIDHEFGEDWTFTIDTNGTGHSSDETIYATRYDATYHAVLKSLEILERVNQQGTITSND